MTLATAREPALALPDEALVVAANRGDREAFARLVDRYRRPALAYARSMLRSREEAEDAAQEAFVRAYASLGRFRTEDRWSAWVMTILRNICLDSLRRRRSGEKLAEDLRTEQGSQCGRPLEDPFREELVDAVRSLPEMLRVPLQMHYGHGCTCREIALALGLKESTVMGRLAGGLRRLRRRLGQEP